jgi:hypothetical protein
MTENRQKNTETSKGGRRTSHLKLSLISVAVITIICFLAWQSCLWNSTSIDKQLAAIEASIAIPDAENAAVYYTRFLTDPNNGSILDDLAGYSPSAYCEPWAGSEYPELAAELKTYNTFIQTLLDISDMPRARFSIYPDPGSDSAQMLADMRKVTFVLSWAAANDLAEGRIEAGFRKHQCQLKLACHLQQQPATYYRLLGIAIEAAAFGNIKRAVIQDDVTPEQLRSLETILETSRNPDEVDTKIAAKVDRLIHDKELSQMSIPGRLRQMWFGRKELKEQEERKRLIHLRLEASRRAIRIFIALRRYKEKTGTWPETLEQIEPKLPEQMLTDPQNNGHFIYKRAGDDFVFYSKGPNNIDEGGSHSGSADDWLVWPRKKIIPATEQ